MAGTSRPVTFHGRTHVTVATGTEIYSDPIDLSVAHFGKISSTPGCLYYVQVKNGKFVVYNGGKPIHGKTVGDPAIIAKYTESGSSSATTTTSAPGS